MKKQLIRIGVWETNSSSSHSLSIGTHENKDFVLSTIYPDSEGRIRLSGGEYGWEWFKTNNSLDKANYSVQSIGLTDNLINAIKEVTGADDVYLLENEGGYNYVDHDSIGLVEDSKDWLINFIFNKNSFLFGGNDNSTPSPDFYIVEEYKEDGSKIDPKFKYKIGSMGTYYLSLERPSNEDITEYFNSLFYDRKITENNIKYKFSHIIDLDAYFIPKEIDRWHIMEQIPNIKKSTYDETDRLVTEYIMENFESIIIKRPITVEEL